MMQTLGRMLVVFVGSLLLIGGLVALPALTSPIEPVALVRLDLLSPDMMAQLEKLNVPVLARLTDAQGATVLLAILSPEQRQTAQAAGLPVAILDADARGALYYLVEGDNLHLQEPAAASLAWLYDDGRQAVIRLRSSRAVANLDALGARIIRLGPDPISLNIPATGAIPESISYDPFIASLIAQITHTTLLSDVGGLSGEWSVPVGGTPYRLLTRYTYSGTPLTKATQYIHERLQTLGYNVTYHHYTLNNYSLRNVIAEKPGRIAPERIVLLTAHLDSRAVAPPHNPAPGADDNASGCAALLQTAEILADMDFAFTIRFVFFTGEEQGMIGSYNYAAAVAAANEQIVGVLNLDMIAWDAVEGPAIDLHSHAPTVYDDSDRLAALFAASIATYDLGLVPQIVENGSPFSDHSRFWDRGYAALMAIEDYYNPAEQPAAPRDWNPYYHTTNDRLSTLNGAYFREFARASLATFVRLAEPLRILTGTVTAGDTGDPLTATVTAAGAWGVFSSTTTTGQYALALPGGIFTVTAEASAYLSQTISAFTVLTGTGAQLDFVLSPVLPPPPYRFELQGHGVRWGDPGALVTHTVFLRNTGAHADAYALQLSASVFTATLPLTITGWVTSPHFVTVPVHVALPYSSILTHDIVTLTVTSVISPLHTAMLPLQTFLRVGRVYLPLLPRSPLLK